MISILMSIYNEKLEWIQQAIYSMLNQSYTDFEFIIIVDNPTIDQSIQDYLRLQQSDNRLKVFYNDINIGLAASLNRALSMASGEYIARMDADDISMPDRLEKQLAFLIQHQLNMVSTLKIEIDEQGKELGKDDFIYDDVALILHKRANFINHPSVLIQTNVLKNLGGYRLLPNAEDYDLWLRMIDKGLKIGVMNEYLIKYRVRANSASIGRALEQFHIEQYVLYLCQQRRKCGQKDDFSIKNMQNFLKHKPSGNLFKKLFHFSKKNFSIANECYKRGQKIKFFYYLLIAFISFPNLVIFTIKKRF